MSSSATNRLLTALIVVILAVVVFVVVVGGILCITDPSYNFGEYLKDLNAIYKLFLTAVLGILCRAVLPLIEKRANGGQTKDGPPKGTA